jgi:hypothetical protein
MTDHIPTTTELKERFHEALRAQHPEWVEPTGACPTCERYELLLAEQLNRCIPEPQQSAA